MKRLVAVIIALVTLTTVCSAAVPAVQAGIFAQGATAVVVKARVVNGPIDNEAFSNVVVTLYWETSAGLSLGAPSSALGSFQASAVKTDGIYSYQSFASTPNVYITWTQDSDHDLFSVTVEGGAGTPVIVELRNPPASANGNWYFETGINGDITNYGELFYSSSTEVALPITLASFTARPSLAHKGILLTWSTLSETNNYGFTIQRRAAPAESFADLDNSFTQGQGTTTTPHTYEFVDRSLTATGEVAYRLKQQDLDGTIHYSEPVTIQASVTAVVEEAPRQFQLLQNYPNPFNPTTDIRFSVGANGPASLRVYNTLGEEVATLFDGEAQAGRYYHVSFAAEGIATGMYVYRLATSDRVDVRKMLLVR